MSWLAELVESSEGSLEGHPVQCLCEFLLHDEDTPALEEDPKLGKHKQKQVCLISVCLSASCLSTCLSECLSVCLSLCFVFSINYVYNINMYVCNQSYFF